jgi:Cys-tRNA(Pro) deacylase
MDETSLARYLTSLEISHEIILVDGSTRTAADAASQLGVPLAHIVKSLVCRTEGGPVLALVPGDRDLSLEKLSDAWGHDRVKLASRRQVEQATGYVVGAVAPVGLASPLPVLADVSLRSLREVYCGGGSTRHMLRISVADLERVTQLEWRELAGPIRVAAGPRHEMAHPAGEGPA